MHNAEIHSKKIIYEDTNFAGHFTSVYITHNNAGRKSREK
jgi:hypothetical protein